jgi:16S rRNA G966 N2-methylase RsmD
MKARIKSLTPPYRSPLGRLQPQTTDLDAIKERGWREQNILVVSASDQRLDFVEREIVRRIGERLYGERLYGGRNHG